MINGLKTRDLEEQSVSGKLLYLHAYHAYAEREGEELDIWPERLSFYHVISSIPTQNLIWFDGINHTIGKFEHRNSSPVATGSAILIMEKNEKCIVQYLEHIIELAEGKTHQQYWQQRDEEEYKRGEYNRVCNMLETAPLMAEEKAEARQQIIAIILEKYLRHQAGEHHTTKIEKI